MSRRQDRRAVRRANRIAAIDQEKPKRTFRRWVIIVAALFVLAAECYVLMLAKIQSDQQASIEISNDLALSLSQLSIALQQGNAAQYTQATADFRTNLQRFDENSYVHNHATTLIDQLKNYDATLIADADIITELTELHLAINKINDTASGALASTVDVVQLYYLRDDYRDLRTSLDRVQSASLQALKAQLISLSDELINYLDSAAVCINVCAEQTLAEKQNAMQGIYRHYAAELTTQSEAISAAYNPNALILALGDYAQL